MMPDAPTTALVARLFQRLVEIEDESLGCARYPGEHVLFCCQWNNVEPCSSCAELEARYKRVLADALQHAGETRPTWRPIETAPKDGSTVLIAWEQSRMVRSGHFGLNKTNGRREWWTEHGTYSGDNAPTHWQPLPAPPSGS